MNRFVSNKKPLFIVGCGRSGTTLLRLIMNRNKGLAIPEETWYIPNIQKYKSEWQSYGNNWEKMAAPVIKELTGSHFEELSVSEIEDELRQTDVKDWVSVSAVVNRWFAKKENKERWGDKTPGYVRRLPVIKELFPDAVIIHLIRDPRDVVPSLLKYPTVGPDTDSFEETVFYWIRQIELGVKNGVKLFGDQYQEIKYEDLVQQTETTVNAICRLSEVEYGAYMLESDEGGNKYVPTWEWHSQTQKKISNERVQLWKTNLTSYQIAFIEYTCKKYLEDFGYEIVGKFNLKAFMKSLIFKVKYNKIISRLRNKVSPV